MNKQMNFVLRLALLAVLLCSMQVEAAGFAEFVKVHKKKVLLFATVGATALAFTFGNWIGDILARTERALKRLEQERIYRSYDEEFIKQLSEITVVETLLLEEREQEHSEITYLALENARLTRLASS